MRPAILPSTYKRCEYLLVIQPKEALLQKIMQVKQAFHEKYETSLPPSKPHLTLVHFLTWEAAEERLVQHLHAIAMATAPFKIELKDYGCFPSHTIYIPVATKNAFQQLVRALRQVRRLMRSPEKDPHFIMEPHITLAYKLLPWQYEKGWLEFSHRHFSGSFVADNMLLLRRYENDICYQIVHRLDFRNLPIGTKQGELFG